MANALFIALFFPFVLSADAVSLRVEEGKNVVATKRHQQDDKCACIVWKDVYSKHGVQCGAAQEYSNFDVKFSPLKVDGLGLDPVSGAVKDEWCTRFFEKLSTNHCVNEKLGSGKQWCYVSSECASAAHNVTTLNRGTGSVELKDVSVKWCDASAGDKLMSATTPEEFNRIADKDGIDGGVEGLFAKLAYPMNRLKWSQVESASVVHEDMLENFHWMLSAFGMSYPGPHPASAAATQELKDVIASGAATIFDEDNGHGGGALVMGNKIYAFQPLSQTDEKLRDIWRYNCMSGCDA